MTHPRLKSLLERLLILPALVLCIGSPAAFAAAVGGGTYHVSGAGDDAAGDGSEANPWRTITHAVAQAGGGAPTIMVGAGIYDQSSGESYPIYIDEHDVAGITISGLGDGSAVIGQGFSGPPLVGMTEDLFEADNYVSGEIVISGLDFEGTTQAVLNLDEGAASLRMEWNNAAGIGLLDVDATPYGGDYVIANNSVADAYSVIEMIFDSPYTDSETVSANLTVQNNTFTNCDVAISYSVDLSSDQWMDVNVLIEGDTFEDCGTVIYEQGSATEEAHYNVNTVINDNTITSCEYPIYFSFEASYTAVINRNIEITNNSIIGSSSSSGIYFTTSVDEYLDYNETVLIDGNNIQGVNSGIYQSFEVSYESSNLDRDWSILNNTIEECSNDGIYLYQQFTDYERGECNFDLTVDGNTIQDNGNHGVYVSHSASYTATSAINHTVTRNYISNNVEDGIYLYVTASTADIDHNVVIRGNVIEGNAPGSAQVSISAHMDTDGSYDLDFDMGSPSAFGYNTIVADGDNPSSSSLYLHVHPSSSMVTADLNLVGNWWGTQDAGLIEDRVYHGPDSSEYFTANLSNPLPDSLDFTAEYVDGVGAVVTAGADAGFVAYAGDIIMGASLDGPDGYYASEIEASLVSEDYQTITLPDPLGEATPGEYEICLMNPGGQTGCASFTVGGDEDCSENQIPTAVSDNAQTAQGTAIVIDLTGNDSDHNGNMDPTAVTITQNPNKGTVVNNGDGTVTYTPDGEHEQTSDTFNYTVGDTCGATSNTASCQVFIGEAGGDNQIPTAVYDSGTTEMGASVNIDILGNDSDSDGDALDTGSVVITQDPAKGSVVVNVDGTVTYTPNEGIVGTTDTFNYTIDDEHGATSNIATVAVFIQYILDTEDVTSGVSGNAGGRTTQGARGGVGNGGTPTYGGTRTP
jgi:hypothetical protein